MGKIEEIEAAVRKLTPEELIAFRVWLEEYEEAVFDARIEADAKAGRLDWLRDEALAEERDGLTRDL